MTLQQLEYFRVLAKTEHFTKTAEILSVSQPSLSYAIGQLETELNINLFDRIGRNIKLNSFGKIFLTYVESALDILDQGTQNIELLTKKINHNIKMGYIYSLTDKLLASIIKTYYLDSSNETITFDFKTDSSLMLNKNLEMEILDIILTAIPPEKNDYVKIFNQHLYLMVPRNHKLSDKKEIDIKEIDGMDFINYRSNTGLRVIIDKLLKFNKTSPIIKMEIDECNAALSLLSLNVGITIMPIVPGIDYSKVVPIKIKDDQAYRHIYLAWNNSTNTNSIVKDFRDFVIELYNNDNFI
ncbi:MAG: LysR family transcriptional regulator [Tissierellia bacterium]|nr:LysR family transcriptional regulator [Tissierellia bacterium]